METVYSHHLPVVNPHFLLHHYYYDHWRSANLRGNQRFGNEFTKTAITVVYYIYDVTFNQGSGARMGYGAAISWILTIIILIVTLIQFKVQNKWVYSAD